MSNVIKILIFLLTVVCFSTFHVPAVFADRWNLPEKRTVCSKNNKYCLKIIPKKLTTQLDYFQDKVGGKENAGADSKINKNVCRGIFSIRDDNGILRKRWEINLVNEVSPVSVLISDQGDYIVTFDNWHGVGYGNDVVAIYGTTNGRLIRKFGLSDFLTESDIQELPASTSSIHWGGTHWIDKEKRQLVLMVTEGIAAYEKNAKFFEVRADLSTGNILDEKRDRLPSLQFLIQAISEEGAYLANSKTPDADECFDRNGVEKISSVALLKQVIDQTRPDYPPAARAVRAVGKVVIEIVIGIDGAVECARPVSGHPLLRASILANVKTWKFQESTNRFSGFIVFDGNYALVAPDGTVIKQNH